MDVKIAAEEYMSLQDKNRKILAISLLLQCKGFTVEHLHDKYHELVEHLINWHQYDLHVFYERAVNKGYFPEKFMKEFSTAYNYLHQEDVAEEYKAKNTQARSTTYHVDQIIKGLNGLQDTPEIRQTIMTAARSDIDKLSSFANRVSKMKPDERHKFAKKIYEIAYPSQPALQKQPILGGTTMSVTPIKLYTTAQHSQELVDALEQIQSALGDSEVKSALEGADVDQAAFDILVSITAGTVIQGSHNQGGVDSALISEMGKAYRERYDLAVTAGDDKIKNQAHGSMMVLAKIKEMMDSAQ